MDDLRVPFMQQFSKKLNMNIVKDTDEELVFDMVGVEAPIANALRRILLAEVRQSEKPCNRPLTVAGTDCCHRKSIHIGKHIRDSRRSFVTSLGPYPDPGGPAND